MSEPVCHAPGSQLCNRVWQNNKFKCPKMHEFAGKLVTIMRQDGTSLSQYSHPAVSTNTHPIFYPWNPYSARTIRRDVRLVQIFYRLCCVSWSSLPFQERTRIPSAFRLEAFPPHSPSSYRGVYDRVQKASTSVKDFSTGSVPKEAHCMKRIGPIWQN